MLRPLEEAVVVVTGASSGIGRAAALRLARRGASLALCARSPEPLAAIAARCEAAGAGGVLHESVDVADEEAVERLAAAAEQRFGRIDVWVNAAAVMAYGDFTEIPSEVFRRIVEVNLMGQVHGARAALRRFDAQGSGVLINVSSVWGRVTSPKVSPYVLSKHAVRALSECIQSELAGRDIHVATIVPEAIDTPIFEHAGNYTGRQVRPIPPMLDPEQVARGIEACAESPKHDVAYGHAGKLLEVLYALAPGLYRRFAHPAFVRGTLGDRPADPAPGNVLEPTGPHSAEGAWRARRPRTLRRAVLGALAGGARGLIGKES